MNKIVYSVDEAAKILGVSKSFCYKLVEQKLIPATKLGKRIIIPVNKLHEFIQQ